MIQIDVKLLLLIMALGSVITLFSGSFKGICDGIGHHDSYAHWGKFFTRQQYHESKYKFLVKYPFWAKTKLRQVIVFNVFVMFLDAWHLFQFLSQIFDHLLFILPIGILLSELYGFETILLGLAALGILYLCFQIGLRIFYT